MTNRHPGVCCKIYILNEASQAITACMDYRIVAVILPILLALSWASYNIARAALGQLQLALSDFKKNTGN